MNLVGLGREGLCQMIEAHSDGAQYFGAQCQRTADSAAGRRGQRARNAIRIQRQAQVGPRRFATGQHPNRPALGGGDNLKATATATKIDDDLTILKFSNTQLDQLGHVAKQAVPLVQQARRLLVDTVFAIQLLIYREQLRRERIELIHRPTELNL